jgi:signal transduction histidine kinase
MPVLIVGLAFVARQVLVASLRSAIDGDLQERAEMVTTTLMPWLGSRDEGYANLLEWLTEERLPSIPLVLRISDPQGNVLATFGDIPDRVAAGMDGLLHLTNTDEGRFDTIEVKGEKALRVYTVALQDPSTLETVVLIQTGDSLAPVTAAQDRLWVQTLAVGFSGGLLACVIGLFIIYRGFRPLDVILTRVSEIETKSLRAGLPKEPRPPEIQQLADNLNSMWHRLDRAIGARETFLATVSHDLRTPLTALQGQIEVLQMQPSLDSEVKQSLEAMARETRRLVRMTNNLLLTTQLESKPVFAAREVNLRELVDETVGDVWVFADGWDLTVGAPEVVLVPGDYDLLKQMLLNVVGNAIKFTPKGGSVELVLRQDETWAIIEVSDSGVGIPPEDLPHVMEPFYKADAGRERGGGAGLGLAIVKQIVELHAGQIEINSQEGVGTTVTIRLPLLPQHHLADNSGRNTSPKP